MPGSIEKIILPGGGCVGAADIALFVLGAADEVAEPVGEVSAVAGLRDEVAGGFVQLTERHAGPDEGLGGFVGAADKVMDRRVLVRDGAAEVGAGHVGAVAVLLAADVEHNAVAGLQAGVVGRMVRVGRVRAEGDDRRKDGPSQPSAWYWASR